MTDGTQAERCKRSDCVIESYPGGHRVHDMVCAGIEMGLDGPGCHAIVRAKEARP